MLKGRRQLIPFLPLFLSPFFISSSSSSSSDMLTPSQSLTGNQTLVSAGGKFELGFFTPHGGNADRIYLGIWYHNLPLSSNAYAWVANRDSPAPNTSVSLKLLGNNSSSTHIAITTTADDANIIWSNSSNRLAAAANPILQLLDSGNLVVREAGDTNPDEDSYLWQSFDYPTDTMLPDQKIGWDNKTGLDRYLTSWKSLSDPSSGDYTYRLNRSGDPEIVVKKKDGEKFFRTGPWVGEHFSGVPTMNNPPTPLNFTFQDNPSQEVDYYVHVVDPAVTIRALIAPDGTFYRYHWAAELQSWNVYWYHPKDQCDYYNVCGDYGVCDINQLFVCVCPSGFEPKDTYAWAQRDGNSGCVRRTRLECGSDGFAMLGGMKLPESGAAAVYRDKGLQECREMCASDCECTAYANRWVVNGVGSGCLMWSTDLKDMSTYGNSGQDLYIRLAASDLAIGT